MQYRKEAMNQSTKLIQNLSKEIKSDNFCYRKVGRAITKWGAIEKSPILLSQYWKKFIKNFYGYKNIKTQIFKKIKLLFLQYIFCLMPNLFKLLKNFNIMKTQIFDKMMYGLKGHPRFIRPPFCQIILEHFDENLNEY